ncbi:unnamed protein product (macronuclear) [Paramecium tetraurelia]|uniref:Uncharacterized protein n=1 Tax=Paramecium tetraurelia TaxID=5888 RepID=A0CHN8_PARTE|nr:uncharacterized protein GSPATT00038407001 [Paramecium tetraurelia]CAK70305.1 unnamed protein product [Paramecium tetraurelia]|eukprot:XP_001437702.1 hypothetical protein (macronuclear) [Paramecium tetraurelia strain d4-2]
MLVIKKRTEKPQAASCCGEIFPSNRQPSFKSSPSPQKYDPQTQPLLQQGKQKDKSRKKIDNNQLTFENLINFVQADGCFRISKEIKSKINFKNLSNHQKLKDDVWFTFLVLLYLENNFSQSKKSWQLVYQKGIQYLQQNGMDYKAKKNEYKL